MNCQQSGFRVFRTGSELREFEQFNAQQRFDAALLFPAAEILEITGANQAATVQEGVSLNIDCLPWLQRFPGGSIQWFSLQLDEFGEVMMGATPTEENPTPPGTIARIVVGGPFNRWLNISRIEIVGGAEDPDSKIFMCEVCVARDTPFEVCHTANYTNRVTGGSPRITEGRNDTCIPGESAFPPGDEGGVQVSVDLGCTISAAVPRPVPPPTLRWLRDGREVARAMTQGQPFDVAMDFLMDFPILTTGVFSSDVMGGGTTISSTFVALTGGELIINTRFDNISNPMLGNLPVGTTFRQARAMLFEILLANWTCVANNTFGSAAVQHNIRMCGDSPVIPDCAATGDPVRFPEDGEVLPPGCDVCIRPGTSVTLNCMVSAGTPPISYNWTLNGTEVSRNARLVVMEPGNYSCTATNLDNAPVVEASVLYFSPRAMIMSRIEGRTTNGCDRLRGVTDEERTQFDSCVFIGETLVVECTSSDPDADLALMGGDGTTYENATARIEVSLDNPDATNMTFSCTINAPGPCGQFMFQTSVRVYEPARINRTVEFGPGRDGHLGAGRPEDVEVGTVNAPVTLRCPTSGITEETTEWRRVIEDSTGCLREQPITAATNGFSVAQEVTGPDNLDDLVLTIQNFNSTFEGTYVCRTENVAGVDADVVSLVTGRGVPEWRTTSFSECSMMCQDGVRTRSVTCRNSRDMLLLPDFSCSDIRPVSRLQCDDLFPIPCFTDPIWVPHPWSRCSQDCKGIRTREVLCQIPRTGEIRPNYECSHIVPKPRRSEVCEDKCCVSDVYPDICSVLGSSHCGALIIQKLCCWTCGLTVIP